MKIHATKALLINFAFGVTLICSPISAQEGDIAAEYQERIPGWLVAGDFEAGGCMATMDPVGGTEITAISLPHRSDLIFSIQNSQWRSIEDGASMHIRAVFRKNGLTTDIWSLATVGINRDNVTPGFRLEIDKAGNDGASFPDQFAASDTLELFNGEIPLGKIPLAQSSEAVALLYQCSAQLRANANFDPFAK